MVAVLFDLEGTLIRTILEDSSFTLEFRQQTREKLIELGIPPQVLGKVKRYTLMCNKAFEYVEKNFSEEKARLFHHELDEVVKGFEMRSAESSKLFPETLATLRKLKRIDCKMGIVTNTSKKAGDFVFSRYELGDFFEVVITREDVKRLKPDPGGVLLALKRLGETEFFLVGDLIYDAQAAEKAGGLSIIVNRNPSKDLEFRADYVVHSLAEIPALIGASKERKTCLGVEPANANMRINHEG